LLISLKLSSPNAALGSGDRSKETEALELWLAQKVQLDEDAALATAATRKTKHFVISTSE
jgi:hypothetical protein